MNTLYAVAILAGVASATLGGFYAYAAGMSDVPADNASKGGCIAVIVGLVLIVAGIVGLLS